MENTVQLLEQVHREMREMALEADYPSVTSFFDGLAEGKKLRARLILLIAPFHSQSPRLAAIIEMIHLSSLLHDDVIDEAATRRGVETVNATHGSKTAVMLGDVFYSKAFHELTKMDNRVAAHVSDAVFKLSVGELMDVEMSEEFNGDEEKYFKMCHLKTGALIESAAYCAALFGGKDPEAYALFGRNLGLAFQIADDLLDVTQDEKVLGKPAFNDYLEGKTTLPFLYLHRRLEGAEREKLESLFRKELTAEEKRWLKKKLASTGALEAVKKYAVALLEEAKGAVGEDEPELHRIADLVIERNR